MKIQAVDLNNAVFTKSTYSNGSGDNCVEVAAIPGIAAVEDSKDRAKGRIVISHAAFEALVQSVKDGRLS